MKRPIAALVLVTAALTLSRAPIAAAAATRARPLPATGASAAAPAHAVTAPAPASHAASSSAPASHPSSSSAKSREARLDLNSATAEELAKLPGVGDAIAAKIVAGRPYKTKRELLARNIVNRGQYSKLATHVVAKQAPAAK